MSTLLGGYQDDALTTQFGPGNPLALQAIVDNLTAGEQEKIMVGYPVEGIQFRRKTLPGTNQLQFGIVDLAALNGGTILQSVESLKFALTQAGLATAIPGEFLNLGVEIFSGVANALPVWVECIDTAGLIGISKNLTVVILDVEDVPL